MFEVPLYKGSGFDYHQQLKESLLSRRTEFCGADSLFNGTGYSTVRSHNQIHNDYPYFKDFIESCAQQYDDKLLITHCWININGTGGYQTRHNHAGWDMVGTYYLSVSESNTGYLNLYHPSPVVEAYHLTRPYHPFTHTHIPTEQDILIWPGYLDHEVTYNHSDDERWSITFLMSLDEDTRRDRFPSMI